MKIQAEEDPSTKSIYNQMISGSPRHLNNSSLFVDPNKPFSPKPVYHNVSPFQSNKKIGILSSLTNDQNMNYQLTNKVLNKELGQSIEGSKKSR